MLRPSDLAMQLFRGYFKLRWTKVRLSASCEQCAAPDWGGTVQSCAIVFTQRYNWSLLLSHVSRQVRPYTLDTMSNQKFQNAFPCLFLVVGQALIKVRKITIKIPVKIWNRLHKLYFTRTFIGGANMHLVCQERWSLFK